MDISQITDYLHVGAHPLHTDAAEIAARDIKLMISMVGETRPPAALCQPPLNMLWLPSYDTFFTPIARTKLLQGVQAALDVIRQGGHVLVFCQMGRHRSVIMAAAILIAGGHTAADAMSLLRARRPVADPQTWYIRWQIQNFEKYWRANRAAEVAEWASTG